MPPPPSVGLCSTVSKSASLAMNPRNGGSAAMLAVAPTAMISSGLLRSPSHASLRMSRVPVAWSMIPTTMNSAALNIACAHSMASPASIISLPPDPTMTVISPSWLTVPNARISLRSYSRTARHPASTIVSRPSVTTVGRHSGESANPGVNPRDQVDAGLDHRGRVQIGAHRRRRRHRAGQPEVHRHDRRLRQRTDEDQHHRHRGRQAGRRVGDQLGQQIGARDVAQHDDADQHRQPAERRHQQCLRRGPTARRAFGVVPDREGTTAPS